MVRGARGDDILPMPGNPGSWRPASWQVNGKRNPTLALTASCDRTGRSLSPEGVGAHVRWIRRIRHFDVGCVIHGRRGGSGAASAAAARHSGKRISCGIGWHPSSPSATPSSPPICVGTATAARRPVPQITSRTACARSAVTRSRSCGIWATTSSASWDTITGHAAPTVWRWITRMVFSGSPSWTWCPSATPTILPTRTSASPIGNGPCSPRQSRCRNSSSTRCRPTWSTSCSTRGLR
jgi:hypothetical protein